MRLIDKDKILYKDLNGDMPQSDIRVWVTFKEWIDAMPTIEERKTGKWISDGVRFKGGYEWMRCSECGWETLDTPIERTNFCPNCGARMEVEHDAEETNGNSRRYPRKT